VPGARRSHVAFFDLLRANPGTWCSLALDAITGANSYKKHLTSLTLAAHRHLKVQITVQQGRLYARAVSEQVAPTDSKPASEHQK
jgi:hypothetical protein